jgi:hypothetical protein
LIDVKAAGGGCLTELSRRNAHNAAGSKHFKDSVRLASAADLKLLHHLRQANCAALPRAGHLSLA